VPRRCPEDWIPLKTAWLHILLALSEGPRHGYSIRALTEERSGGKVKLWPVTLYGSLRDMEEDDLIVALEGDDEPDDDGRRQYYELTGLGRDVLRAEIERLQGLVNQALTSPALSGS